MTAFDAAHGDSCVGEIERVRGIRVPVHASISWIALLFERIVDITSLLAVPAHDPESIFKHIGSFGGSDGPSSDDPLRG